MPASTTTNDEAPWRAGLHGARALLGPGLVLQAAALALVLAWYFVPAAHELFARLAAWRTAGGYVFSAVASALCGGVLPFLYLRLNPATRPFNPWPHLFFFTFFWAWKGAEVDLWYRTLAWVFGGTPSAATVIPKVLADQFGYNLLYAAPVGNLCFAWKDAGFRWAPVAADMRAGRWYARRVLPVLLATWAVWLPVVSCVYALPPPLQIPLFNVVLCFWSLLFAHILARQIRQPAPPIR
jgi:hypothetical protein